ncbi:MAG: DUF4386 family protein [Pseudomonadota bacterium]|jgi:hypothetical protein
MNSRRALVITIIIHTALMLTAYFGLVIFFDFPDILRRTPMLILEKFNANRDLIVGFYAAFMWSQVAFVLVVLAIGERFRDTSTAWLRCGVFLGVVAGFAQAIGFSRWPFVVGGLADAAVDSPAAALTTLQAIHQFAGVAVGEHLFFVFETLWVLCLALHLLEKPQGSHVSRTGALLLVPVGAAIGVYGLEQFGGVFAVLGPVNAVAHGALLFWLVGLAVRQMFDRPLRKWESAALTVVWAAIVFPGMF